MVKKKYMKTSASTEKKLIVPSEKFQVREVSYLPRPIPPPRSLTAYWPRFFLINNKLSANYEYGHE